MGRTKGSKNGISTTPGYTAIGDLAQQVPAGYKRVVRRVAGRAGGPVHLKYEYVYDEDAANTSNSSTDESEEEEGREQQEEATASKTSATKGPDNDIARRVEQVKARQKAAGSEYAKQLYKLKLKRTKGAPTINSAYDLATYKKKKK